MHRPRFIALVFAALWLVSAGCTMTPGGGGDDVGDMNSNGDSSTNRTCDDGTVGLAAPLAGSDGRTATMTYRALAGGCREFVTTIAGFDPGIYEVVADGVSLGMVTAGETGLGELSFDTIRNNFPADFPQLDPGDAGSVNGDTLGVFAVDCPASPIICVDDEGGGGNFAETCDEDASAWIETLVENVQTLEGPGACVNIKPTLVTRTAGITFHNRHPTRSVAIAAIQIVTSDRQNIPQAPCDYLIGLGAYASVDDCIANEGQGCNSPPSLILQPDAVSPQWVYNCLDEDYHPNSGMCGNLVLESTRIRILAQAVFCNNFGLGQAVFCEPVHPHLLSTGDPHPGYGWIEDASCPE